MKVQVFESVNEKKKKRMKKKEQRTKNEKHKIKLSLSVSESKTLILNFKGHPPIYKRWKVRTQLAKKSSKVALDFF